MTPSDIIKWLRICATDNHAKECADCPYNCGTYEDGCGQLLADAALLLKVAYEKPENNAEIRKVEFQKLLHDSGLSQSEAARRLHVAASYICKIRSGAVAPSMALLLEAREILGGHHESV